MESNMNNSSPTPSLPSNGTNEPSMEPTPSEPPVMVPGTRPTPSFPSRPPVVVIPRPPVVGEPEGGTGITRPCPSCSNAVVTGFANIRFLHAAGGWGPLAIRIGNRMLVNNLSYSNLSSYSLVADGFRTFTVFSLSNPRNILLRTTLPLNSGEKATIAIVNTNTGIALVKISDTTCQSRPFGMGCLRVVNLSFGSPALDVSLSDGRVIYTDIQFKEATPYKRIRQGSYHFIISESVSNIPMPLMEDIETVESSYGSSQINPYEPLLHVHLNVRANVMYTIYILGQYNGVPAMSTLVTEDY